MTPAIIYVHGVPAMSWDQVASYAKGDAHDRSKLQVLIDGRFYPLVIQGDQR